ncbi:MULTISPECIES: ferredoxin [Neobacillus]|uniref:Ferredoxin n=2 Tax=Neobacillus TaxID=2675232 RepID=A0A942UAC8_9BACI|nr:MULTISPECIES: ferredoxin [Neobacillus]MBS4215133.1 ferredoxin [Neobacillus rhizophilus]MCH6264528.1 ferredoxin [Neobacillus citreus]
MKVTIDQNVCLGKEMCLEIAPEVFKIGKEGKSSVYQSDP